ncbi:sensor histidine kinase [Nonomuraea sp. LPB2021202275-12-8]|uniref:sensor histidine kinase n=1 Tax=Nonomuraea sp. LPB2021202275-12-8 TaxID=3120159 RepID=UPI00300DBCF9
MATRPETAKKILLHWMDATIALLGFVFAAHIVSMAAEERISVPVALFALACMTGVLVLYCLILRDAYDDRPLPAVKLAVGALLAAGAVLLPTLHLTDVGMWENIAYIWLASAVLYLPLWATVCLGAGLLTALTVFLTAVTTSPWQTVLVGQLISAPLVPAATWIWCWMWRTIRDAHDSQEAKARLAVSEERLRFARDLHDLLGHSLSVITLKSELAAKMATKDAARAASEMSEVRRLAGESLIEVQLAVDGYRSLDLDVELAGVRAALEAAGARCTIDARAHDLSPAARTLLAWVVREGATNVLKHSRATRCSITIGGGVLEMRNDGVDSPAAGSGSGLRGLAERMVTAGGSFTAESTPTGEFLLTAKVPA